MSTGLHRHGTTDGKGPDLDPLLEDLRSMPQVHARAELVESIHARIQATDNPSASDKKRWFSPFALLRGNKLAVLSVSAATVTVVIIGIRLLQTPDLENIIPAPLPAPLQSPRDDVRSEGTETTLPAQPGAASENKQSGQTDIDGMHARDGRTHTRQNAGESGSEFEDRKLAFPSPEGVPAESRKGGQGNSTDENERDTSRDKGTIDDAASGNAPIPETIQGVEFQREYTPDTAKDELRAKAATNALDSSSRKDSTKIPAVRPRR